MVELVDVSEKPKCVTNCVLDDWVDEAGKKQTRWVGIRADQIHDSIKSHVGDWPKAVGEAIYCIQGGEIRRLDNPATFFGWLAAEGITIDWKNNCYSGLSRDVFFQYVRIKCSRYHSIETIPHYPQLDKVHYELDVDPTGIYQGTLTTFLKMFCPETPLDLVYLRAMFLTPVWGGRGGARPAFVLLGPEGDKGGGRGVGKTTLTDMLALLFGTCVDFEPDADRDQMGKRLLTTTGRRIIRFDNVKHKMSGQAFESMITAVNISGHQMYVGDAALPNFFTWVITFNQPDFSTDMAQRAIPIRLGRPKPDPDWEDSVAEYVKNNRWKIICDCVRILKSAPRCTLENHIRFAQWSKAVLSRCTNNPKVTTDIENRQNMVDYDEPVINQIYDIIESNIERYVFNGGMYTDTPTLASACIRVKKSIVMNWITDEIRHMSSRKIMHLLETERPDWLVIDGIDTKKRENGRVVLGPTPGGTHFLEFGNGSVTQTWNIDEDWRKNYRVNKVMSRASGAVRPV